MIIKTPRKELSVLLLLLLLRSEIVAKSLHPSYTLARNSEIKKINISAGILVKNWAWFPPFCSVPLPSVTFFTSTFTSTEVPLFFLQVGKCYIWLRPYRRGLRFGTYLGWNFRFGLQSRGQNVSKWLFFDTNAQIGSVRNCSNGLKFGMNIGLYMGQILG